MQTLNDKRTAFLEDTCKFYNLGNRAVESGDYPNEPVCVYTPTETSPGCAIGRHLKLEDAQELAKYNHGLLGYYENPDLRSLYNKCIPDRLKELGVGFLSDIQTLHDLEENWTDKGLSDGGKKYKSMILENIKDDTYEKEPETVTL